MRRSYKLAMYLLWISIVTAIGIWFCKSEVCTPIHEYLFRFNLFLIFKGNREFCINLLMGIGTSAIFASLGFFIDYFEKKREYREELFRFYRTIRNRCFKRLFYEQNSYDEDPNEVSELCDLLSEYINPVMDYRPPLLLKKIKIYKLFHKSKSNEDTKVEYPFSLFEHGWIFNKYMSEDRYGLICSVLGELYKYFGFINMNQSSIAENERIIDLCERRLAQPMDPNENAYQYKYYLDNAKRHITVLERRLKSRFPWNTKEYQGFINKKELYSKFYAIDSHFSKELYTDHGAAFLLTELCIVEDEDILYSKTDEAIKLP